MPLPFLKSIAFTALICILLTSCVRQEVAYRDLAASWTEQELRLIRSLWLGSLEPLPKSLSNAAADNPQAATFGKKLFFDPQFSDNGKVACSTCHQPEKYFTDGLALAEGIGRAGRGSPSLLGIAYSPWLYWDGRRDSLWSQALTPLETPVEHGFSRQRVIAVIAKTSEYRNDYRQIFGPLPKADSEQEVVNRAFANIGKAIEAFERTLMPAPSRFDNYAAALTEKSGLSAQPLSEDERAGLKLFISQKAGCMRCHNGPLFSNFGFHNIGLIELKPGVRKYDLGRIKGIKQVLNNEFNCTGPYSDAEPESCLELKYIKTRGRELKGAFKVPTLRNVAETAPYMHDGRFKTLQEVLRHYREAPKKRMGHQELNPLKLTDKEINQITAFLKSLTGPPINKANF